MKQYEQIKWFNVTVNVDMDTGEILTKKETETYYRVVRTTKTTKINQNVTKGIIKWTKLCRRNTEQGKLFE